jgi:hypothetical protein
MTRKTRQQGVVPPTPIINRRTGAATQFGPRWQFDDAYVRELLNATGCTAEEAATVTTVLEPLLENCGGFTVEHLLGLLKWYVPYERPHPHLIVIK